MLSFCSCDRYIGYLFPDKCSLFVSDNFLFIFLLFTYLGSFNTWMISVLIFNFDKKFSCLPLHLNSLHLSVESTVYYIHFFLIFLVYCVWVYVILSLI